MKIPDLYIRNRKIIKDGIKPTDERKCRVYSTSSIHATVLEGGDPTYRGDEDG